jgi:hypothetical protein
VHPTAPAGRVKMSKLDAKSEEKKRVVKEQDLLEGSYLHFVCK